MRERGGEFQAPAETLGGAIAYIRRSLDLTQAELAALMSARGVAWRREQVLRVEAGQRELGAHEALVVAYVLGVDLVTLYAYAGYPERLWSAALGGDQGPVWPPAVLRTATPALRAYMTGDHAARRAVDRVVGAWRIYEEASGRAPAARAERAKRASLWAQYEADPEGFKARANRAAIDQLHGKEDDR